jgi:hypothetical protein
MDVVYRFSGLGASSNGAENGDRTHDLRVTSALLYQLSYLGK